MIVFAIFIYEMNYVAGISQDVENNMKQKDILEFNSQFEGYADKRIDEGAYLNIPNAISVQEFVTICNLKRNWNKNNPSDIITIVINHYTTPNISEYVNNDNKPLEKFLYDLYKEKQYYFIFKSESIEYNEETGRIDKIIVQFCKK